MSLVFVLLHDDISYDMGGGYEIRGVYATATAAGDALVTRTPSGQRSRAWDAHTDACCSVEPFELLAEPEFDVRQYPPFAEARREP